MVLPGAAWLIYSSTFRFWECGCIQRTTISGEGFIDSIMKSKWVGLDNFKFSLVPKMPSLSQETRYCTTLDLSSIGLIVSVGIAIILSELRSKQMVKMLQNLHVVPLLPILGYHQFLYRCLP